MVGNSLPCLKVKSIPVIVVLWRTTLFTYCMPKKCPKLSILGQTVFFRESCQALQIGMIEKCPVSSAVFFKAKKVLTTWKPFTCLCFQHHVKMIQKMERSECSMCCVDLFLSSSALLLSQCVRKPRPVHLPTYSLSIKEYRDTQPWNPLGPSESSINEVCSESRL